MAMFGFVYLWYLMVVLLVEIWLDYRAEIVRKAQTSKGVLKWVYSAMTLGSRNVSEGALRIDDKVGYIVTVIGIPSAFLLHGYVGFIFGSVKANAWWSTPLMPIVFLFSAMVSGIAAVMLIYMAVSRLQKRRIDMRCLDAIARYLFYVFLIDFSLEMLDLVHRIYEADESFHSLDFMVHTRLYISQVIIQIWIGTLLPLALLGLTQLKRLGETVRRRVYAAAGLLTLIGIFAMAVERRHRRPALLEELPGLHHLQTRIRDSRGFASQHCPDAAAVSHPLGADQTFAALRGAAFDIGVRHGADPSGARHRTG